VRTFRAFLLVLAGLSVTVAPVRAQRLPFELGIGIARNGSPPAVLSADGCAADVGWAAEGRASLRFSKAVRLEGNLGYHFESGVACTDPLGPPPAAGPFEDTQRTVPDAGYPFFSTDARLAFEPSSPAGSMWVRAFGGYGRMWSKNIGYWLAGGGLVYGGQIETVIDFEWNWFSVPFEETARVFQDGILVSESMSRGSTSHSEFRIKAGFRFRL